MRLSIFISGFVAGVASFIASPHLAAQDVIVSDDFTINAERQVDGALNKLPVENGEGIWSAQEGTIFSADGKVVSREPSQKTAPSYSALVDFPTPDSPAKVSVEAKVILGDADWIGIGLQTKRTIADWFAPDNVVWAFIRPSGKWQIMGEGMDRTIDSGTYPDMTTSESHLLKLTYDGLNHTITLSIDGEDIASNLNADFIDPATIRSAGFCGLAVKTPGSSSVDDVKVTVSTPAQN